MKKVNQSHALMSKTFLIALRNQKYKLTAAQKIPQRIQILGKGIWKSKDFADDD
jgi:hypothetical protein